MANNIHNSHIPECRHCGDEYPTERWAIGYKWCLPCGEILAKEARKSWTIAPMHKSNYMLLTNLEDLKGINNKGGLYS
jgi:ribosomal protein L37AE/L43A